MLFTKSVYLCLCRLVPEIQVWKHVRLLVLAALAGLGGLGLLGDWGPSNFLPNSWWDAETDQYKEPMVNTKII